MKVVDGEYFTLEEWQLITNGCGAAGSFRPPEDGHFDCPCRYHDVRYALGGWEWHRWLADAKLLKDSISYSWRFSKIYAFPWHVVVAIIYFIALFAGGWFNFSYSVKKNPPFLILERAAARAEGRNPKASINEHIKSWTKRK